MFYFMFDWMSNQDIFTCVQLNHSETIGWSFQEADSDKVEIVFKKFVKVWIAKVKSFGYELDKLKKR